MKYNPISGVLRTDEGAFLKKLDCPIGATQEDMIAENDGTFCSLCERRVLNLDGLDDAFIERVFSERPDQCVFFTLDDPNVKVDIDERDQ